AERVDGAARRDLAAAIGPADLGEGSLEYASFAEAVRDGVVAKELPEPSVNDIVIDNPTGRPVLLFDGEEVQGAQQNRVFDGSFIVPGVARAEVPVCCVEQNRWQSSRRGESFVASRQVSGHDMRAARARSARQDAEGRSDQGEVWATIDCLARDTGADAGTLAMSDVYDTLDDELERGLLEVPLHQGQTGVLVLRDGAFVALDWVSRPEAWAELHPRVVRGHLFAERAHLRGEQRTGAGLVEGRSGLRFVRELPIEAGAKAGLGTRVRTVDGAPAEGTGLVVGDQLVQWSAFACAA
ncbi:MAG: ARPP-1 family domain-containing protein, partial [Polyangiales bacterium]